MGKIKQGILGGFSGKVANVVGSSWKGIAVMKSLPLSVANPKTAAQILQRERFKNLVILAASILTSVVKPLWDRFAQKMSGFNDFVKSNFENFVGETSEIYFPGIEISKGKMLAAASFTGVWTDATTLKLTWTSNSADPYALATDIPYIVFIEETSDIADAVPVGEATRATGTLTFVEPAFASSTLNTHAYIAFKRADGTIVSDTKYALIEEV